MRISLVVAAIVELCACVVCALHGAWESAALYLLLACSQIGWALAETAARTWKLKAAERLAIIKSMDKP